MKTKPSLKWYRRFIQQQATGNCDGNEIKTKTFAPAKQSEVKNKRKNETSKTWQSKTKLNMPYKYLVDFDYSWRLMLFCELMIIMPFWRNSNRQRCRSHSTRPNSGFFLNVYTKTHLYTLTSRNPVKRIAIVLKVRIISNNSVVNYRVDWMTRNASQFHFVWTVFFSLLFQFCSKFIH